LSGEKRFTKSGTKFNCAVANTTNMRNMKLTFALVAAIGLTAPGCSAWKNTSNKNRGAVIGAGGGAVVGGVIGKVAGNTGLGAIIGAGVGGVAGGIIGNRMDKQAEEIKKQVPDAKVERVGEGIVVEFNSAVLFATNQSSLSSAATSNLDKLTTILNEYAQTNLEVDGHTDNTGSDAYNQKLSEQRASSVASYLKGKGISASRITTRGKGESYPKYDNTTEDGRAGNRRVEFQITANEQMKKEAQQEAAKG
jgi:outer membrane protein OmpA-like peptidoglycan-associated protein